MSEADQPSYNRVFEALVETNDDLTGLVAYSLYKQHKRDWLIRFREATGASPSSQELNAFLLSVLLPDQIAQYRQAAADALVGYAQAFVLAEEPKIREEAISQRIALAAHQIESAGRWQRQIVPGIAAAAIWTLFLIALALLLRFAGIDVLDIIESVSARSRAT
jgi:hypothetical protein